MSNAILSQKEFNRSLKSLENKETGQFYLDEIITFLEQHQSETPERRKMYEHFKKIEQMMKQVTDEPKTFRITSPNGEKLLLVGIPSSRF